MLRLIRVPLTDGQFDALVSFTFNLGAGALQCSTLHRQTNRGEHDAAALEFLKWVWAAGRQLPAGYWTIGYGHLCDSKHTPITETEAEVWPVTCRGRSPPHCATVRCWPPSRRTDWPPSPTSRSILVLGACKPRRCDDGSTSKTGLVRHGNCAGGFTAEGVYCLGWWKDATQRF